MYCWLRFRTPRHAEHQDLQDAFHEHIPALRSQGGEEGPHNSRLPVILSWNIRHLAPIPYLRYTVHTMSTESLKLQLIERLLRTNNETLLKRIADLFRKEKDEAEVDGLTDEHFSIVKDRYEEYKRGEGTGHTWEEVCEMARKAEKA